MFSSIWVFKGGCQLGIQYGLPTEYNRRTRFEERTTYGLLKIRWRFVLTCGHMVALHTGANLQRSACSSIVSLLERDSKLNQSYRFVVKINSKEKKQS